MRRAITTLVLGCALCTVAVTPGNPVGNGHRVAVSHTDNGCSVYPSTPNPCEPDSAN